MKKSLSEIVYLELKRGIDVIGCTIILGICLPVMLLTALAVKVTSPGPIIFAQKRLTQGGRIFWIYKFRTMRSDAEKSSGAVWATVGDSRVTPIGRFLRLVRLDELPQLINVLIGDMSLVGPRPERPELVAQIEEKLPDFRKRLAVKAGLTGLAQIEAGYASDLDEYDKKLALDLKYIENRSIWLDISLLFRTVSVIVFRKGSR